jgi:hypothetical protein
MFADLETIANDVNESSLSALLNEEILAIHVPKYVCRHACEAMVSRFNAEDFSYYQHENNTVGHLGLSAYDIESDKQKLAYYYTHVDTAERQRQKIFCDYQDPLIRFKQRVRSIHPYGIRRENFHGMPMFAGMLRRIAIGSCVMVHQDNVSWVSQTQKAKSMISQFALNIYLQANGRGGELMIWRDKYSQANFNQLTNDAYCFPFNDYREPDLVIKPETGDLILFNANFCHAVNHVKDEDRIALSAFIGWYGKEKPLTYWS